jgi:hypothetical protein
MADDLVTVARSQFFAEAEAARVHVSAEGISAFLFCAAGLLKPVEEVCAGYEEEYGGKVRIEPAGRTPAR